LGRKRLTDGGRRGEACDWKKKASRISPGTESNGKNENSLETPQGPEFKDPSLISLRLLLQPRTANVECHDYSPGQKDKKGGGRSGVEEGG